MNRNQEPIRLDEILTLDQRSMAKHPIYTERGSAAGLLLSHNQIAVLEGLATFERGEAPSSLAWLEASLPALSRFKKPNLGNLRKSLCRLSKTFVVRVADGNRIRTALTPRGRAVLDGRIPVKIIGHGWYRPGSSGDGESSLS